MENVGKRVR
jgi:hypothetical protein